jgi:signal transduction histidine kinase
MTAHPAFLLLEGLAERRHGWVALVVVAGLLLGLVVVAPFADISLEGTEALLPAYAAIVLLVDLITATLLVAQFAVHGAVALLILAVGYLVSGLAVVPWALTFPGVFSETGLLGAGLQTTASLAAFRRVVFPIALIGYAVARPEPGMPVATPSRTGPLIGLALGGSAAVTAAVTWAAIAGQHLAPVFMTDVRASTTTWTLVLYASLLLTLTAAAVLLYRPRRSLLDLWLLVTIAAFLNEIVLLGFLGAGVRFSVGWWAGRTFGLVASSTIMLALLAETTTLHARLLRALIAESREQDARTMMLKALTAALAHELNQPLASIVASADAATRWLDRPEPDIAQARSRLRRISAEGHSAAAIITSVRWAFARRPARDGAVDVGRLVQEAVGLMQAEAKLAGASIEVHLGSELPRIQGDALALRQAVLNLLANAVDAVGEVAQGPRRIRVACSRHEGEVTISVADSGDGVLEIEHLFDPFYSTKAEGLGLGLMICRTVVESHGGRVIARRNVPRGAVFEIVLPTGTPRERAGADA